MANEFASKRFLVHAWACPAVTVIDASSVVIASAVVVVVPAVNILAKGPVYVLRS